MKIRSFVLLCAVAACATANANLLTNGSFETLAGSGAAGWSFTGDALAFAANAYVTNAGGSGVSPYGTNLASFNAGEQPTPGSVSQSFSTVLGRVYTLSFAYGQFGGAFGNQQLTFDVTSGGVLAFGNLVPTNPTTNLSSIFQTYTTTFVGTGNLATLTFTDIGTTQPSSTDLLLDNVSLTAVPGPSALLAFGIGALGRMRRRRA